MKRAHDMSRAAGILASVLVSTATVGCGGSKTGVPTGGGGALRGVGGATGIGAGGASLGPGGAMTGAGGATGAAGGGTGGLIVANSGGITGGRATGGNGGRTTLVAGTGGGIDAGAAGTGAGGRGTGGRTTGGAGGAATGGTSGLDGGAPAKCSDITTQAECDARSGCHSVFVDPQTCDCLTLDCSCARFRSCADGDKANCTGEALCDMVTPYCEGPYVIAYRNNCYEGCVKQTDCALPACPQAPPADGAACGRLSQTCYYEDCAGTGRTIATCASGAWKVTTSSCAAVECEIAPDIDPSGIICPAGQVCVLTDSSGALPPMTTAACVDHTCGKGPVSPECVPDLHGDCTPSYSAAGAIFRCQLPTP